MFASMTLLSALLSTVSPLDPPITELTSGSQLVADANAGQDKRKSAAKEEKLEVGKLAISFHAKTMTGRSVKFPEDYKGKMVLLDFWATWCRPCMEELPNVVAAYEKYHDRGFEVLGVTLDQSKAKEKIQAVEKEKGMKWPQIYDGKGWKAALAVKYGVDRIPHAILVDGDSGNVLAINVRGESLGPAIEKALDAKKAAPPKEAAKDDTKKKGDDKKKDTK